MSNSSIWPIGRTLLGAIIPGQSGPGSDDNERVLPIPQNFSITEASPSDSLASYTGHLLRESYPSTEMQLVCSPKLLHYWSFTIRLFSVIYRILGGVLSFYRDAVGLFYSPNRLHK